MRKLGVIFFATLTLLLAAPALASSFDSFDQQVTIVADGEVSVHEVVKVSFSSSRHGIYRDIPVYYKTDAGTVISIDPSVVSVSRDDASEPYTAYEYGDKLRVKIGDAGVTLFGEHTYVIDYTVSGVLLSLTDHDELYWNVNTAAWGDLGLPTVITAEVYLPEGVPASEIRMRCFSALGVGAAENCPKSATSSEAAFASGSGYLTVVVGWPKGKVTVTEPRVVPPDEVPSEIVTPAEMKPSTPWWTLAYPAIVFLLLLIHWARKGRDPERKGPLVVQYDPPDNAAPAEVGVLFDEKADLQDVTATIVHLAVRGYLKIIETDKKYSFELRKPFAVDPALTEYERATLGGLFASGTPIGEAVPLSSLENKFYKVLPGIKNGMDAATVARGWFAKSPDQVRGVYMAIGFGYIFLTIWFLSGIILPILGVSGPVGFISLILPGTFFMLFGYFMPARTQKGADAYSYALGFKEYLSKAEKYRIKWEEKENIFEKFLPYAMVFGVVDKWAKAFEGIALQAPDWYQGSWSGGFMPLYLANSLTQATSRMGQSLATAPSSRGGGGFGGGGGGGGGFGGGGGGSW